MEATKKRRLLTSPRFAFPLAAVILLIAGFGIYYFVVIGRQEASVDDRALRSLAAVASQLKDLVGTYGVVLKGATQRGGSNDSDILSFLAAQGAGLGDVDKCKDSPYAEIFRARASQKEPWIAAGVVPKDNGYSLELASNGRCSHVSFEKALSPLLAQTPNQIFDEIVLTDRAGTVLYQTQRAGIVADDLAYLSWRIEGVRPPAGAEGQGPKQAEENDKSTKPGGTLSGSSGLSAGGSDKTSEKDTSAFSGASETSSVFRIALAGTDYRVYMVPARLPVPSPSASGVEVGARFVLCGLIRQDHFRTKSRSLPLTVLTSIALAVFLVIVAAWPVLKFATMKRTEHITRLAGLYYALFSAATIIVLILFIIHMNYGFSDPKTEDNLQDLALAIDRNVAKELQRVLHVMELVGESPEMKQAKYVRHEPSACQPSSDQHPKSVVTDLLTKVGMQVAEYPYFRRLVVLDGQGFEQVQWTVDAKEPPPLRVCDRPYFQGTVRNDLWYLRDEGLSGHRFRVDPIYSKSTGEYLAAIAKRFEITQPGTPVDSGVMVMLTPMLSLIRPVLPPDYGFAVIDETGKVLFHSESAKNLRENFFDECSDDKALRAAVLARRSGRLNVNYLGVNHEAFVTPFAQIQQCPWSLIVFSNQLILGDKHLERIVLLAILAGMYFALLAVAVFLLRVWLPCYDLVWPKESMKASYCHLCGVLIVTILLSYELVFEGSPKEVLWFAVIIPASSLTFVILKLKANLRLIVIAAAMFAIGSLLILAGNETISSSSWQGSRYFSTALICAVYLSLGSKSITNHFPRWKRRNLTTVYSLGCFVLLLLIAALPCIAFFKVSFDYDENLSTRRQQLLIMAALENREQQVRNQYFRVAVSDKSRASADDLGKWLFLRRRLQEETLDLYDKEFQDQQPGQIYSSEDTAAKDTTAKDTADHPSQWPGWLIWVAANCVPRRAGSLTQQVSGESLPGSKWKWSEQGANRIHVDSNENAGTEKEGSPETMALAKLAFQDPKFLAPNLTYDLAVLKPTDFLENTWLLTAILLICMFWSIRSTIVKIFLLDKKIDEWTGTTLPQAIGRDGNSILVGLPCSGKTKWLQDCEQSGMIKTIDAATGFRGGAIDRATDLKVIALDHFEYGIDNPQANQWKINLLEELMFDKEGKYRLDRKVVIVTTVDPRFYFENADRAPVDTLSTGAPNESDMERWTRVLSRFDVFRLEAVSAPVSNKFYHHFLWATCTWSEKMALHPLAERGWANHKNYPALEHLFNRGLIKLDPGRISDEKFRKYVSSSITRQERKSLALRDRGGLWDGLRTTLIVLLLGGLAAILFFNQNEVLGYFASGISALTAASKIVSEVRGRRVAEAGKGGTDSG